MQADLFGTKKKQAGYKKRGITHSDIYLPPTPEGESSFRKEENNG